MKQRRWHCCNAHWLPVCPLAIGL
ncbi:unnamed protein product, partial [Rotaria magnacalcarata]